MIDGLKAYTLVRNVESMVKAAINLKEAAMADEYLALIYSDVATKLRAAADELDPND